MSQRTASGWLLGQPHRALAAAGLLVDHADHEQVAVRRAPARRAPAPAPRSPRRPSGTSCPGAPRPHSSPSTTSPDHGSRCHSAGSASTVSTCESRHSVGPSPAPRRRATRFGRSSVRPSSVDLEAASRSMPASMLLGRALVAGRVDRVEAHEALEQLGGLALEVVGHRPQATRRPRWAVHRRAREDVGHEPALRHRRRRAQARLAPTPWHARWPRACGRDRSTSSWARSTCSPRARRCAARSSRAARTR